MTDKELADKAKKVVADAKKKGVKVHKPDLVLDMFEPMLGREAREFIEELCGNNGTFSTVRAMNTSRLCEFVGINEEDEWFEAIADTIYDKHQDDVFEVPPGYKPKETYGSVGPCIMFFYAKKS